VHVKLYIEWLRLQSVEVSNNYSTYIRQKPRLFYRAHRSQACLELLVLASHQIFDYIFEVSASTILEPLAVRAVDYYDAARCERDIKYTAYVQLSNQSAGQSTSRPFIAQRTYY